MSEELKMEAKRCPWCGDVPEFVYDGHVHDRSWNVSISCPNEDCIAYSMDYGFASEQEAIQAWNTRTATTDYDFNYAVHDGRLWSVVEECRAVPMDDAGKPPFNTGNIIFNSLTEGCSKCGYPWGNNSGYTYCPHCGRAIVKEASNADD